MLTNVGNKGEMMTNKNNSLPDLSDAQMEIMTIIWEQGEVTVNQVWQILKERRDVARNTVQTLISRMEEKDCLLRRKVGNLYLYKPAFEKKESLPKILDNFISNMFGGSTNNLVMSLFQKKDLSANDVQAIKDLIKDFERKNK